jgi:hypothetical protein
MKTKKDADEALGMVEHLKQVAAGSRELGEVTRFITDVRAQLPDAEMSPEERRQAVEQAARKGYAGT